MAAPALRLVDGGGGEPPEEDCASERERPLIRVAKGAGHVAVPAAVEALAAEPDIYERNGALVHVVGAAEPRPGGRAILAPGTPIVRVMAPSTLWERCSRAAAWERFDGRSKEWIASDPPAPIVSALISRGDYPGVRPLTGILEAPALRPDGTLAFGAGYDDATGFLLCPSIDFDPPPAEPTPTQSADAFLEMREVFEDFPHVSENSRMVPIAGILTLLARPAILGPVPAIGFDAATRGSGKTRQADAVTLLALGRIAPPLSYPADDEELEKIMGALALAGPAAIKFDNVTCRFGGGPIDRVLTAHDTTTFRVLGKSETPELRWRALVMMTGSNLELRGDAARRVLISRLESPLENPEERPEGEFRHPDLLAWIRRERARLVRAALTVLRGWVCAGRPRSGVGRDGKPWSIKTWGGGFEEWSAIVPAAIVWAGGVDPMATRPAMTGEEEPEKVSLSLILAGLSRLDPDGVGMTTRSIVELLYPKDRLRGEAARDGYEDMREAIEALAPTRSGQPPSTKTLGEKLRGLGKGRVIAGRKLDGVRGHGGAPRWRVVVAT